ncbi:MAG: carbon-nitrogen hydrolase family protein [Candidatus Omnitrophica bacterium]|nr:carbon-nitrogen hydrolase family protein [Candidatus Omnitrophota bacterium]
MGGSVKMKVALIQMSAGKDKTKNVEKSVDFVNNAVAQKAKFILLPEVFNYRGFLSTDKIKNVAEEVPGYSLEALLKIARNKKVYILAGSVYEKVRGNTKVYNTSVLISPSGVSAVYRKKHLFSWSSGRKNKIIEESQIFLPGKRLALARVEKFNVGLSVCFDVRFAEMFQEYCRKGAEVLCVPSAFLKQTGQAHWEILLRCRAVENLCYVLAPNQCGIDERGIETFGHSMIVSPWGEILAEASGTKEEIIFAHMNKKNLVRCRKILSNKVTK